MKTQPPRNQNCGFSRAELWAVVSVLAILTVTAFTAMARSREPGLRIGCANNLRQLGIAVLIYSSENDGMFPPRSLPRWPAKLQPYYGDLFVLRCPNDGPNPATFGGLDAADRAPRSYIFNGWSDYYSGIAPANASFPESAIRYPAATVLLGEKATDSGHFWMVYLAGDDMSELEEGRHFRLKPSDARSGGSNYAMADGGVRFLKFGASLSPTNLWFVVDQLRTNTIGGL